MLYKSIKFICTVGTTPGYNNNNEDKDIDFIKILKEICEEQEAISDIYVSFIVQPSKCIYKEEWGCPKDGEDTITISATMNPYFEKNVNAWMLTCTEIMKKLMKRLKQHTITGEFSNVDIVYDINDDLENNHKDKPKPNIMDKYSYDDKYLNKVPIDSYYLFCLEYDPERIEVYNTKIDYSKKYESLRHIKVLADGSYISYYNDAEVLITCFKNDNFIFITSALHHNNFENVMLDLNTGVILRDKSCECMNDVKNAFIEFYTDYIKHLQNDNIDYSVYRDAEIKIIKMSDLLKRRIEKLQ